MFKIFGEHYYIDLDEIAEYTKIEDEIKSGDTENFESQAKIHIVKFDMVKYMLEILMDPHDEIDEKIAMSSTNETSIPFRFAFNTLLQQMASSPTSYNAAELQTAKDAIAPRQAAIDACVTHDDLDALM